MMQQRSPLLFKKKRKKTTYKQSLEGWNGSRQQLLWLLLIHGHVFIKIKWG